MFLTKEDFRESFVKRFENFYGKSFNEGTLQEQYNTLGLFLREYISESWIETNKNYHNERQAYYFSIEFLLGRLLESNLLNLDIYNLIQEGLQDLGISLEELEEKEIDAGLGNGGLGRLAACFLDSLASLNLPGHGVGIRYKYGLFHQKIVNGYQVEFPEEWLRGGNPWEIRRVDEFVKVHFCGRVETSYSKGKLEFLHLNPEVVYAVPYDIPIIGYQNKTVNTLRLWSAEAAAYQLNTIDVGKYRWETEKISEILYPDDTHVNGKILRLKQQYFLVSAGIQSIIGNYLKAGNNISDLHKKIALHVNDTHPVLAIPELMRILMDEKGLSWDEAWQITTNTVSYTNHTTLSEALEKWPISIFKPLLPRIYMIIEEINERFCSNLWSHYPGDWHRISEMAIVSYGQIKMAHLAIVGSHSVNGVAKLHSEILKKREMKRFFDVFPKKFNNKTNGITHRRWLLKANPQLATLINEAIGDSWISNPEDLKALLNFAKDTSFQEKIIEVKLENKKNLAKRIKTETGLAIDEYSIFDVQVKRLHAYKRQLLNLLHIMYLYNRLKEDSSFEITPRTFIFGAKASPSYHYAKKIIKLINTLAEKVNNDNQINKTLRVVFLENYRVSLAEEIFPATDVSEQISTASKEASGTGNMKAMINGAITIGTLDGANIEILEEVGASNIFTFGLTADEVMEYYKTGSYHGFQYYQQNPTLNKTVDQLKSGFFPVPLNEFQEIHSSLIERDEYFVLKDFSSYAAAQEKLNQAYNHRPGWAEKSIINISKAGKFSSDRTINEYASEIWKIKP